MLQQPAACVARGEVFAILTADRCATLCLWGCKPGCPNGNDSLLHKLRQCSTSSRALHQMGHAPRAVETQRTEL